MDLMLNLYLQTLEIRDINAFNIAIDALTENDLLMKEHHFELAIRGITINARNQEATRRVLVAGEAIIAVSKATGIHHTQLGKQVKRVLSNFEEQLQKRNLICESWILGGDLKSLIDALEDKSVLAAEGLYGLPKKPRKPRVKTKD